MLSHHRFDLKHEVHTELNLACVGIHPNKEIMVCGAVQDLWVHVLDYETGGIVGRSELECDGVAVR